MNQDRDLPSAPRILLLILGINSVAEISVMLLFAAVLGETRYPIIEALLDAMFLSLVLTPCLLIAVVRPIRKVAQMRANLLAHLYQSVEAERSRLARELHDEIGQSFTAMLVHTEMIAQATDLESARAMAGNLRSIGHGLHDDIRRIARGLHPRVLDDLGLTVALERLAAELQTIHGIEVALDTFAFGARRLPPAIELVFYRIAQEAATNAVKHAEAKKLSIELASTPVSVVLKVADNGRGFDAARRQAGGMGLHSMRERAASVHGRLSIRSRRGAGTTVELAIPLAAVDAAPNNKAELTPSPSA